MQASNQVALYIRVSSEAQVDGYSLEGQEAVLREDVKKRGKIVFRVYRDEGISGVREDRKGFNALLKDAKNGLFSEVLVWSISRISRKLAYFLKVTDELKTLGIALRSVSERIDINTPMGQFSLTMMAAVAEMQRESWMEASLLGMKKRAKMGRHNGGNMLGYQVVPDHDDPRGGSKLTIIQEEAAIVELIFTLYVQGLGYKAIVNRLNTEGKTTKMGRSFSINGISVILKNPIYAGWVKFHNSLHEGIHEPIISQELWAIVQERLNANTKAAAKIVDHEYLLAAVLRCPECNSTMVPSHAKNRRKNGTFRLNHYYICSAYLNKGRTVCRPNNIRADGVEEEVFIWLDDILNNPFWIKKIARTIKEKNLGESNNQKMKARLEDIVLRQKELLVKYENGRICKEDMVVEAQALKLEKEKLSASLVANDENKEQLKWSEKDIQVAFKQLHIILAKATADKKRKLIRAMVEKVLVNNNRQIAEIELRAPLPVRVGVDGAAMTIYKAIQQQ